MPRQHLSRRMPSQDRLAVRRFELVAAEYVQQMGARIAARRQEKGLSQIDVARALPGKVDGSQVSRWERGLHRPSDDTLERLGEILEVPVSYFMAPPAEKDNGTPDLLGVEPSQLDRMQAELSAVRALLQALATRFEVDAPPAPPGELGRRLQAVETTEEDRDPHESPPAEGAPPSSG
jgi:transcriptional regulator with XRE-family HTH domain